MVFKVCELYCGGGVDAEKWDEAQIGHYIGIGMVSCVFCVYFCTMAELKMVVLVVAMGRWFIIWNNPKKRSMGEPEEGLYC